MKLPIQGVHLALELYEFGKVCIPVQIPSHDVRSHSGSGLEIEKTASLNGVVDDLICQGSRHVETIVRLWLSD